MRCWLFGSGLRVLYKMMQKGGKMAKVGIDDDYINFTLFTLYIKLKMAREEAKQRVRARIKRIEGGVKHGEDGRT